MNDIKRTYINEPDLDTPPEDKNAGYNKEVKQIVEVDPEFANLVISLTDDGMHAPCIDLDFPAELYPSSQLGHYHLYLNKKVTWESYVNLLNALTQAGLVEAGYTAASITRGYSSLRPVGQVKPGGMPTTKKLLVENAELRRTNYQLLQALNELKQLTPDVQPETVNG